MPLGHVAAPGARQRRKQPQSSGGCACLDAGGTLHHASPRDSAAQACTLRLMPATAPWGRRPGSEACGRTSDSRWCCRAAATTLAQSAPASCAANTAPASAGRAAAWPSVAIAASTLACKARRGRSCWSHAGGALHAAVPWHARRTAADTDVAQLPCRAPACSTSQGRRSAPAARARRSLGDSHTAGRRVVHQAGHAQGLRAAPAAASCARRRGCAAPARRRPRPPQSPPRTPPTGSSSAPGPRLRAPPADAASRVKWRRCWTRHRDAGVGGTPQ